MKGCAEDSAESLLDDQCEQTASAQVDLGLAGCEAEENQLDQLLVEAGFDPAEFNLSGKRVSVTQC